MRRERALDQIVIADGCSTERDYEVHAARGSGQAREFFGANGNDPEIDGLSAPLAHHGLDRVGRRRDDAAGRARLAGARELIAGCHDGDARFARDIELREIGRGKKSDISC